jgi:hypothetical protein
VALEYLPTWSAEPRAVLLQAGLNGTVVAEILAAKTLGVARAGTLLLRRAGTLRKCERDIRNQKHQCESKLRHHAPHIGKEATVTGRLTPLADLCSVNARALTSIITAKASVMAAVTSWLASFMGVP